MSHDLKAVEEAILRVVLVAGIAAGFGYLVFGSALLNIGMIWFEFVTSGITIAIAYMAFRSGRARNGFVVLLFWYLCMIAFIYVPHNSWMPIMEASYVVGLTAAVYVFFILKRRHVIKGSVQRIVGVALLIGITHGLVVLFLQLITLRLFAHPMTSLGWGFMNLKYGMVIGLLCGVGMELSEYIISSRMLHRSISI